MNALSPPCLIGLLAAHLAGASGFEITVRPVFEGEPVRLDSLRYPTADGETLSVTRLSLLLSAFALETVDGKWVESGNRFAFLDLETHRLSHRLDDVPPGNYRALRFAVGLDPGINASDPAAYPADHPLNPTLNHLHWSWQDGYIFLALEGRRRQASGRLDAWSLHFARDPNHTAVTLPLTLDVTSAPSTEVAFDLALLLRGPRPISLLKDGNSTHSRDGDPLAAALRENLPGSFRAREITPRGDSASSLSLIHQSDGRAEPGQPGAGAQRRPPQATTVPPSGLVRGNVPVPLDLPSSATPYRFAISARFPVPDLPRDNPLTLERIALGRRLFHEPLLSRTGTLSCASCHDAAHAFSDPRPRSLGVNGEEGARHSMPLFNLAWKSSFFWDGRAPSLRKQALEPIADHREMDESVDRAVATLTGHSDYRSLFAKGFASPGITAEKIGLALENYLLTLVSDDSRFDQTMRGEETLTADEHRGFELFFTEYDPRSRQFGADCFHCHGGPLFSDHQFHDNGLADPNDPGRFAATGLESDRGKFATPSLRNVALTAPYMHDGRFASLEEAVAHYATGVQPGTGLDPNLAKHPGGRVPLSSQDQRSLVAFLKTLSQVTLRR